MSNHQMDRIPGPTSRAAAPWRRRAWTSVALVPLFFVLAFPVGQGIYALLGYQPENADAPVWVVLVASVLIVSVVLVPCAAAVYAGRRAVKAGDRGGLLPAAVGALAGVAVIGLAVVPEIGNVVGR